MAHIAITIIMAIPPIGAHRISILFIRLGMATTIVTGAGMAMAADTEAIITEAIGGMAHLVVRRMVLDTTVSFIRNPLFY